jgi:hypothetical protein
LIHPNCRGLKKEGNYRIIKREIISRSCSSLNDSKEISAWIFFALPLTSNLLFFSIFFLTRFADSNFTNRTVLPSLVN